MTTHEHIRPHEPPGRPTRRIYCYTPTCQRSDAKAARLCGHEPAGAQPSYAAVGGSAAIDQFVATAFPSERRPNGAVSLLSPPFQSRVAAGGAPEFTLYAQSAAWHQLVASPSLCHPAPHELSPTDAWKIVRARSLPIVPPKAPCQIKGRPTRRLHDAVAGRLVQFTTGRLGA
jgi:hypothetical protein